MAHQPGSAGSAGCLLEKQALAGIDGWLRVRGDFCFDQQLSSSLSEPSLEAVVVDVDVEPSEAESGGGQAGRGRRDCLANEPDERYRQRNSHLFALP